MVNSITDRQRIEYKLWKKNVPYLYDFFNATALDTPSLTLQWYNTPAEATIQNGDAARYTTHKLLLGSHGAPKLSGSSIESSSLGSSSPSNHTGEFIAIANIDLPTGPFRTPSIVPSKLVDSTSATLNSVVFSANNASPANLLPYSVFPSYPQQTPANFKIVQTIPHRNPLVKNSNYTDLLVARYNPLSSSQVATFTTQGELLIYNINDSTESPRILVGHSHGGSAIDWNITTDGYLASGASDGSVAFWDISRSSSPGLNASSITPPTNLAASVKRSLSSSLKNTYQPLMFSDNIHLAPVMDVKWNRHMPTVFGTCSEDGSIALLDTRANIIDPIARISGAHTQAIDADSVLASPSSVSGKSAKANKNGKLVAPSTRGTNTPTPEPGRKESPEAAARRKRLAEPSIALGSVNSISFNPFNEYLFASGGSDRAVNIWDLRLLGSEATPIYSLQGGHSGDVTSVKWSPTHSSIIASAGYDRRIVVWDASKIGQNDQFSHEEQEDGPPELLFLHGGHTSRIADFDWHPSLPFVMASIGEDNVVQVWKAADHVTKEFEDDLHEEEEEEEEEEK